MSAKHSSISMPEISDERFVDTLSRIAREDPDRVYLKYEDDVYTVQDIDRLSNQIANALLDTGLVPGDHVGLMLPNHPMHLISIFALMKAGLVRVPVNVHAKGSSLLHYFESFDVKLLISDVAFKPTLHDSVPETSRPKFVWFGTDNTEEPTFESLVTHHNSQNPGVDYGVDELISLTPSSGTTGAPKGVIKSDRTLRAGPVAVLRLTEAGPGDTFLLWEPLHHGAGVAVTIAALLGGVTVAMVPRFSASQFWDQIHRYNVTHIHYLGGVLPILLKQPVTEKERTHNVRMAWGGGCPTDIWKEVESRFNVVINEGYGLSELITFVTLNKEGVVGSCGVPIDYYDIRLLNDDGEECRVGEIGEIVARAKVGGLDFLGYYNNDKAAQESMSDASPSASGHPLRSRQGVLISPSIFIRSV